jgi:DNA-binding NarL/FixJ family response regulator
MSVRIFLVESHPDFLAAASCFLSMLPEVLVVGQSAVCDGAINSIQRALPDLVLLSIDLPRGGDSNLERQLLLLEQPPHMALLSMHELGDQSPALLASQKTTFVNKANFVKEIIPIIKSVDQKCSCRSIH